MAPPMHSLALGAVAIAVSLALYGCEGAVSSFADAVCKTTIDAVVDAAQNEYQPKVENECRELRDHASEQGLNASKSDELYDECISTAGIHVIQEVAAQQENYTNQCLDFINGGGDALRKTWSQLASAAHTFIHEHHFEQDLDSLLDSAVLEDIQKLAGKFQGSEEGDDATGDGKGSDEKGTTEKRGDAKGDETDADEKGSEESSSKENSGDAETSEKASDEKGGEEEGTDGKAEAEKSESNETEGDDDDGDLDVRR